mgnify:CR=1 FL=1
MDFAAILELLGAMLAGIDYEALISGIVTFVGDLIAGLL